MKNPFRKAKVDIPIGEPMRGVQPRVAPVTREELRSELETNPYLEARREWNERYGTYIIQASNWRRIAVLSSITALSCVLGLVYVSSQTRIVPYVVEVDKIGDARAQGLAEQAQPVDNRIIKYALGNFIGWWRTLPSDRVVHKDSIQKLYAMLPVSSPALNKLNEQFRAKSPFKEAETNGVSVQLVSILPISGQTWQAEWLETYRDMRGQLLKTVRFKATLTVTVSPPTTEDEISRNPLGVYVSDLNFTQQL
ncbi:MAG: conjugal transfer protein TrbF [Burkholderiales bacterium]|nr:conjugal transfer protein TrbF [Burkholderiales bacterium]